MTMVDVENEAAFACEGRIAVGTGKGTLSRVGAHVPLEVDKLSERSGTQATLEGALARMHAKVVVHVAPRFSRVMTLAAGMQYTEPGHE